jgi:hypothetical protein
MVCVRSAEPQVGSVTQLVSCGKPHGCTYPRFLIDTNLRSRIASLAEKSFTVDGSPGRNLIAPAMCPWHRSELSGLPSA